MRFGSSKPVSQDELREARNCLQLLKAKMRTEPPPYFAEADATAPAQGNYRKAFKPQMKAPPPQEDDYYQQPPAPKYEPRRAQAKAPPPQEDDYYDQPPAPKYEPRRAQVKAPPPEEDDYYEEPAPKREPRRPQNYGHLEESGGASYKFDEIEGAEAGGNDERVECPDCGRKFNHSAMAKHAKICKKVFMSKRKKFDISSKRAAEGASEVAVVEEMPANRRKPAARPPPKAEVKGGVSKDKWKRQSDQFRANLRAARLAGTGDNEGYEEARKQAADAEDADLTRCQHCNRTFNHEAAARHIPICERKAKEAAMKNRGSKAPVRGKR